MFDGVPWAVENGANTTAAVARAAHYAATRGAQGVTEPGDLKVTATATPSQQVSVAAGSATILNHAAPGESYHGLARTPTPQPISVSGAARTDLLIARIIDPDFSPWQPSDVPDPVNGPYFLPHVVQGVSPSTTKASDVVSYSAVALARIAVPASGNITNAMITDLRQLAQPRQEPQQFTVVPSANETLTLGAYGAWPTQTSRQVFVPAWATKVIVEVLMGGLKVSAGAVWGAVRARLGASLTTTPAGYDINTTNSDNAYDRTTLFVADTLTLPSVYRGTTQTFSLEGVRSGGATAIEVDGTTTVSMKLTFLEGAA